MRGRVNQCEKRRAALACALRGACPLAWRPLPLGLAPGAGVGTPPRHGIGHCAEWCHEEFKPGVTPSHINMIYGKLGDILSLAEASPGPQAQRGGGYFGKSPRAYIFYVGEVCDAKC